MKIKSLLHLGKFEYVYIRRILNRSPRIYHIYLDTFFPNYKIVPSEVKHYETCNFIGLSGKKLKKLKFSLPIPIDDFNESLGNRDVFVVFDAAGEYHYKDRDSKAIEIKPEEPESLKHKIIRTFATKALTGGLI